jgi:hypothetical protein
MSEEKIGSREECEAARDELAKLEAEHAKLGCPRSRRGTSPRSRR